VGRIPGQAFVALFVALAWYGLGRLAPFDAPMAAIMSMAPFIAIVLVSVGAALARLRGWLPWSLGGVVLLAALFVPRAYVAATTPASPPLPSIPQAAADAPDVVLVVLDTVRAWNVSSYGYARDTAPTIERLAEEGVLFTDATSPSTWSLPSHASLFTGRYPSSHGAHGEHVELDARYPTLAEVLTARGYETFCFTSNPWISDGLGLTRGFRFQQQVAEAHGGAGKNFVFVHRLIDRLGWSEADKGGAQVADDFKQWALERPRDAPPAFVFLNFLEAHFPYHQLPRGFVSFYTDQPLDELAEISMALTAMQFGGPNVDTEAARGPAVDMYDGGIVYSDELLRRVIEALRKRGTLDDTVLVVLADHGEMMGERAGYFGHGLSLYQPTISVPFLVRYPPRIPAGARVAQPVTTVAAFATILDLAKIEPPPTLQAESLVPAANGLAASASPVLAEKMGSFALGIGGRALPDPQMDGDLRYRALRVDSYKLVETSQGDTFLFDLASDPSESRDLALERPAELARMRGELERARSMLSLPHLDADLGAPEALPELDEATTERLRQLGYVE
jgi:arylsulfatase A-like enzyme